MAEGEFPPETRARQRDGEGRIVEHDHLEAFSGREERAKCRGNGQQCRASLIGLEALDLAPRNRRQAGQVRLDRCDQAGRGLFDFGGRVARDDPDRRVARLVVPHDDSRRP